MASVFEVTYSYDDEVGLYTTRELADEAAKRTGGVVRERELDEMPELPNGKYCWFVEFGRDGSVEVSTIHPEWMQSEENDCRAVACGFRAWIRHETREGAIADAIAMAKPQGLVKGHA